MCINKRIFESVLEVFLLRKNVTNRFKAGICDDHVLKCKLNKLLQKQQVQNWFILSRTKVRHSFLLLMKFHETFQSEYTYRNIAHFITLLWLFPLTRYLLYEIFYNRLNFPHTGITSRHTIKILFNYFFLRK